MRAIRGTQAELKKNMDQLDKTDDQRNTILHIIAYRIAIDKECRTPRVTLRCRCGWVA